MENQKIIVRNARQSDLHPITKLEREIFCPHGIEPFTYEHFSDWLEVYAPGFFVAELEGRIVGYVYSQIIECYPEDPDEISRWKTFNAMIGNGYTKYTHKPNGTHHLGVSIGSIISGAGKLLTSASVELGKNSKKPLLGMSRISGFGKYYTDLSKKGAIPAEPHKEMKNAIALSYSLQCAKITNSSINLIMNCPGADYNGLPVLPDPDQPDAILRKYLRNGNLSIWAVLPDFIDDAASLNYSVLIGPVL